MRLLAPALLLAACGGEPVTTPPECPPQQYVLRVDEVCHERTREGYACDVCRDLNGCAVTLDGATTYCAVDCSDPRCR